MIEIIPAVLPKSVTDLEVQLAHIQDLGGTVQIDMVDGVYAKNISWPYSAAGSFDAFASGDEGIPFWREFEFQFDVMAQHPELHVEEYVRAGASSIVIHARAEGAMDALKLLQQYRGTELVPVEVGVALMAGASPELLLPFEGLYDFVQVMGIGRVGVQGEPFDERCLELIQKLRTLYPQLVIQVDGGIDMETIKKIAQAGVNRAIVGHAIVRADDPMEAITDLRGAAV
jgi:ribulose-phosphate 3-epimerase